MSMTYQGTGLVIADVTISPRSFCGKVGAGCFFLHFGVEFLQKTYDEGLAFSISSLRALVSLSGSPNLVIGLATPSAVDFLNYPYPKAMNLPRRNLGFDLRLTRAELEAIEKHRKGGDARFFIEVIGTATAHKISEKPGLRVNILPSADIVENYLWEQRLATVEIPYTISESDWGAILGQMQYGNSMLYEIPWVNKDDAASEAFNEFEKAKSSFFSGDYGGTIASCRQCLDAAEIKGSSKLATAMDELRNDKKLTDMSLSKRFLLIAVSVRNITHLAHHERISFSREEARYILGMTALCLSLAANSPGSLKPDNNINTVF